MNISSLLSRPGWGYGQEGMSLLNSSRGRGPGLGVLWCEMPPVALPGPRAVLLAAALLLLPSLADAQDAAPPAWRGTWDFLVQSVCLDAQGRVLAGASPLDSLANCPRQRKVGVGERLPYHKRDWPGVADRGSLPDGYQQSDSFPVLTRLGPAVVQTYDFGDGPPGRGRRFGQFDHGDGGQVAFFTGGSAAFGITEDGGAGLQFFIGPGCSPVDSWVLVDSTFDPAVRPAGETLARITRQQDRCPARLGYAYTRWYVQPFAFRTKVRGQPGTAELTTLVSDHFGGQSVERADHLERFYFTRELGYTRWERWQNLSVRDRAGDRRQAAELAATGRCAPGLGAPSAAGWALVDCREWTQLVPPADPAGDLPAFWLDKLRGYEATRAIFGQQ